MVILVRLYSCSVDDSAMLKGSIFKLKQMLHAFSSMPQFIEILELYLCLLKCISPASDIEFALLIWPSVIHSVICAVVVHDDMN